MARPKYQKEQATARERLVEAFWSCLSDAQQKRLTVAGISKAAGVNHNTFYYHFENIEQMAMQLMHENAFVELAEQILTSTQRGTLEIHEWELPSDAAVRLSHFSILARNGSPELIALLKGTLENTWLDVIGRAEEDLSESDHLKLSFLSGGIISLLSSMREPNAELLQELLSSSLGRGIRRTLAELAGRSV
jgi:AcrR family transcriptional regulator